MYTDHDTINNHVTLHTPMYIDAVKESQKQAIDDTSMQLAARKIRNEYGFQIWALQDPPLKCQQCDAPITSATSAHVSHPHLKAYRMTLCKSKECKLQVESLSSVVKAGTWFKDTASGTVTKSASSASSSGSAWSARTKKHDVPAPLQHPDWTPFKSICSFCTESCSRINLLHHPRFPKYITHVCAKKTCGNQAVIQVNAEVSIITSSEMRATQKHLADSRFAGRFFNSNQCGVCRRVLLGDDEPVPRQSMTFTSTIAKGTVEVPVVKIGHRCAPQCPERRGIDHLDRDIPPEKRTNPPNVCSICQGNHFEGKNTNELYHHPLLVDLSATSCGSVKCNSQFSRFIQSALTKDHASATAASPGRDLAEMCRFIPNNTPLVVTSFYRDFVNSLGMPLKYLEETYFKFACNDIQRHGSRHGWFPNQNIAFQDSFFQGINHGLTSEFWSNGNIKRLRCAGQKRTFEEDTTGGPKEIIKVLDATSIRLQQLKGCESRSGDSSFCMGLLQRPTGKYKRTKYMKQFSSAGTCVNESSESEWTTAVEKDIHSWKTCNWKQ